MPVIAPWAQPWVRKAVKVDPNQLNVKLAFRSLLRDCLILSCSSLSSIGSNAYLTYSRIIAILSLKRADVDSLPDSENWLLLRTLGTLFQFEHGYSVSFLHYIVDLLKQQPNTATEARKRLLIYFGKISSNSTLSPAELQGLIQKVMESIPKASISNASKDLQETGGMWARMSRFKFELVPAKFLDELAAYLKALSLPKLMSSRQTIVQSIQMVDCARHVVSALKQRNLDFSRFEIELTRINQIIYSKKNALSKFDNYEALKLCSLRAMMETNFDKSFSLISDILGDFIEPHSVHSKKAVLKYLYRYMLDHSDAIQVQDLVFSECKRYLACHPTSALKPQLKKLLDLQLSHHLNIGLFTPFTDPLSSNQNISCDSGFQESYLASTPIDSSVNFRITCETCEEGEIQVDQTVEEIEIVSRFFDDMNTHGAVLETFNRFGMSTLQHLIILADFPDQQNNAFLSGLQASLIRQRDQPEDSTHAGLIQLVHQFMKRPLAQRELILCILRAPRLLSNPLFLYHFSRVSLGFQAMAMTTQPAGMPVHQIQHFVPPSTPMTMQISSVDDEADKLRKRKEMALKMVDDLEEEEFRTLKRISPLQVDTEVLHPSQSTDMEVSQDLNIVAVEPVSVGRQTRSKSAKATKAASSGVGQDATPAKGRSKDNATELNPGEQTASAKKASAKKAKKNGAKTTAALSGEKSPKKGAKQKKEPAPRQVCHHWLQHKCYKGVDCPFLHEGTQATFDTICKFFRTGNCTKGEACPFSHNLKSEACANLVNSDSCKYGERCAYSHDPSMVDAAKRVVEERQRQLALEKAEREKASTLPFAHLIVPLSPQDTLYLNSTTQSTASVQDETRSETTMSEKEITPDGQLADPLLQHAYVPPSLSSLLQVSQTPQAPTTISSFNPETPVLIPPLAPLKPPSL